MKHKDSAEKIAHDIKKVMYKEFLKYAEKHKKSK
jgi:hypothetical protein